MVNLSLKMKKKNNYTLRLRKRKTKYALLLLFGGMALRWLLTQRATRPLQGIVFLIDSRRIKFKVGIQTGPTIRRQSIELHAPIEKSIRNPSTLSDNWLEKIEQNRKFAFGPANKEHLVEISIA